MSESLNHLELVDRMIGYVEREYRPAYELVIFHDKPSVIGGEKPPRIGGYQPDLYATDTPVSIIILGEAKTEDDLETEHSRNQLIAYLRFLAWQPRGVLVLAVPWQASATATNVLWRLQRDHNALNVQTVVLTDAEG